MKMNRSYLLLFCVLYFIHSNSASTYTCDPTASCGCSIVSTSVTARIVGGQAAPDHAWGWAIQLLKSGSLACTGVLISSEYALTAAHCVSDTTASELSIIAGTNNLYDSNEPAQRRDIIGFYIHPDYNSTLHINDIAVLHFSALTISSNSTIQFICLPSSNIDPYTVGSSVVAVGWGVTSEGSTTPSSYLQQVTLQVFSSTATGCQNTRINDVNGQVCAGVSGGGKDTCQGDSGAPLMSFVNNQWILGGITIYGVGCARANYLGVYTRVSTYVSFIDYVINFGGVTASATQTSAQASAGTSAQTASGTHANSAVNLGSFSYKLIFFYIFSLLILINI